MANQANICLCLSLDWTWHKVKWPRGQIGVGFRGRESQTGPETRAVLVIGWSSAHLVQCEPMNLVGHGLKHDSKQVYLIIAYTGRRSPVLYKGVKGVNGAACPLEAGPAENGGLSASSLPLSIEYPARLTDKRQRSLCTKLVANQAYICLCLSPDRTWHKVK